MKICVFIKQVPAEGNVKTSLDFSLVREGIATTINPPDLNAVEEALRIKEKIGGIVTACTMAPASAESMLRNVAAMGVDHLCLISDRAFAGSDTYATAKTLSRAVQHLGGFDLLLCGRRSIDGETGQVGPELAEFLHIPCITNCVSVRIDERNLYCRRFLDHEYQEWRVGMPALLTVYFGINSPRLPSIAGLRRARNVAVDTLTPAALGLTAEECGLQGSPTRVFHVTTKPFGKRSPTYRNGMEGLEPAIELIHQVQGKG